MAAFFKPLLLLFFSVTLLMLAPVHLQNSVSGNSFKYEGLWRQSEWVEEQMQKLTPDERIGQLFMVAAYSNKDAAHEDAIMRLVEQYKIGGLIFMQGTPAKQISLTNRYQLAAKVPMLIAIDGEWGLSMRLENTPRFPKQLTLGAIQDNRLLFDMGKEIARQCRRIGVNVNLAPVVDVNNNPNNPVIYDRSFGEDKYNVAQKGIAYMQGMENNGIMACAKHFPGHGDTNADSHYTLPVINHNLAHLLDIELYPFKELIQSGIGGVMTAHLSVPALDNTTVKPGATQTTPTTLSKKVITNLLKNDLHFEGLVFTDALNMKGVSSFFAPGMVDVKALMAGNDILLFSENVGKAIEEIKNAIARNEITQTDIDERVRKILKAKFKLGLDKFEPLTVDNIYADLNTPSADLLIRNLYKNALTLARNDLQLVPFKQLETKQFASLSIGANTLTDFQRYLDKYAPFEHHTLKTTDTERAYSQKFEDLKGFSQVIIGLHKMTNKAASNYGIPPSAISLINRLRQVTQVTLVVFGSPYSLSNFGGMETVLAAYEDNPITQSLAAQALFGAIPLLGKLPVSASGYYAYAQGTATAGALRFEYSMPEDAGINSQYLSQPIDSIAQQAIADGATPGCVVLVAKNGKVIFEKAYGYQTYGKDVAVQTTDIYDLASVTKIAATTLGIMEMYERGYMGLYDTLGKFLPEIDGSNKAGLRIRNILIHEAGLEAWIPFFEKTLATGVRDQIYHPVPDSTWSVEVAKDMYMRKDYIQIMYETIKNSPLPNKEYKYSDLGYFYFKAILEKYAGKPLDKFVAERYYSHLGGNTLGFNPHHRFSKRRIVPSENDTKWRFQRVQGYVHDMGAAMLGGVGGHAGLFADANDLAMVMQMLLNKGHYGGERFFNQSTIDLFTAYQKEGSRRGLAFDKPETNPNLPSPTGKLCSYKTFGHTGFTGTCAWADPDNDLVFVFLSNRTYPKMNNNKLIGMSIRNKLQDAVYEAMAKSSGKIK
ncbi:hypothetical protein C7N43_18710 [Sphingobacteriales bacterium UPWRP_1]|nr:hypothetical protein B6N25_06555 [Sphingobacteriales bacterium TSM_CSS]PSJ75482.1 hypothetical protein C7N43_18710 [Sphingobacteriales bacterium UPWRP_1]